MRSKNTESKRAFGYIRVSSDRQAQEGDSLEAQRRAVELICELEGFKLAGLFADPATSGSVPLGQRAEGKKLLEALQHGDVVIGVKLDRMFRDATDATGTLKAMKKRGVGLYLKDLGGDVTESNVSALVFGLLSNVAEFERTRIAERISDVKADQRARGRFLGGAAPFGYMKVKRDGKQYVEPIASVHDVARRLRALGYSARLAAGHFTGLGHSVSHVARLWNTMAESL
jgi:putative DNA-invertase from lambdoid prophage Rac